MTYLVIYGTETTEWRLPRQSLEEALLRDWGNVIVLGRSSQDVGDADGKEVAELFETKDFRLEARIEKSGRCLYLDGDPEEIASFVAWYRKLIPVDVEVIFLDSFYTFSEVIPRGISKGDVMEMFPE